VPSSGEERERGGRRRPSCGRREGVSSGRHPKSSGNVSEPDSPLSDDHTQTLERSTMTDEREQGSQHGQAGRRWQARRSGSFRSPDNAEPSERPPPRPRPRSFPPSPPPPPRQDTFACGRRPVPPARGTSPSDPVSHRLPRVTPTRAGVSGQPATASSPRPLSPPPTPVSSSTASMADPSPSTSKLSEDASDDYLPRKVSNFACTSCQKKKRKCDGGRPQCRSCARSRSAVCVYKRSVEEPF